MHKLLLPFRQKGTLNTVFLCTVFLSFHYFLIIYVNSSFLSQFFTETQVSGLYIISSIIGVFALLNASKILEKTGGYKFAVFASTIEFLSVLGMVVAEQPFLIGIYFLLHSLAISLIMFNLDLFVESLMTNENHTGTIRAAYITIASVVIIVASSLVSIILLTDNYTYVYLVSVIFMVPFHYYLKKLKKIKTKPIKHIKLKETFGHYLANPDLHNVFISNFILQFFYAFMIVYTPIYLTKYIGFAWSEVGIMFTIMLLPFVLFEIPVGEAEDEKYGEKEFLTLGLVIMGMATLFMSFITANSFWIWATILFISRIGASFVEVSAESYFFKHVDQEKTDVISFFRVTRPLSFIAAPILFTIALQFIPFQYLFLIVGALIIVGTRYSLALNDTK